MGSVLIISAVAGLMSSMSILTGMGSVFYRMVLLLLTAILICILSIRIVNNDTRKYGSEKGVTFWNDVDDSDRSYPFADSFHSPCTQPSSTPSSSKKMHESPSGLSMPDSLMLRGKTHILTSSVVNKQRQRLLNDYRPTKRDNYMKDA